MSARNQPIVIESDTDSGSDADIDDARPRQRRRIEHQPAANTHDLTVAEGTDRQATAAVPTGATGVFDRDERKALEAARRERQRQRRRAAGLASDSDEGEGNAGSNSQNSRLNDTLPSSASGPSRPLVRSYASEQAPVASAGRSNNPHSNGTNHGHTSSYGPQDTSTGASSWGVAATSGLGGSTKPALRRILSGERFWDGIVKRSYNRFTRDGMPFSDMLLPTTKNNPAGLQHAVLASYCYDYEWLADILPPKDVVQPGRGSCPGPRLTFITMEKPGDMPAGVYETPLGAVLAVKSLGREFSSMHMKFLMLYYPDRLRLCILTGNLMECDWDLLENAAYIQDFPLIPGDRHVDSGDVYEQLTMVLRSLDVPTAHPALKSLSRFDLSRGPKIIASVASRTPHRGIEQVRKVGLGRLNELVREIMGGRVGAGGVQLEAQGSSMGTYSQRWLQQFHLIASGVPMGGRLGGVPLPQGQAAATKLYLHKIGTPTDNGTNSSNGTGNSARSIDDSSSSNVGVSSSRNALSLLSSNGANGSGLPEWPPIKILFPTDDFVRNRSAAGPDGGGCHFGKPDKFQKWRDLCYHAVSERHGGILMHQKGLLGFKKGADDEASTQQQDLDEVVGWSVMTSANFGSSAWGNVTTTTTTTTGSGNAAATSEIQMTSSNWELGVIFPLSRKDLIAPRQTSLSSNARSAVCWRRPAKPYGPGDVPWSPVSATLE